MLRDYFFERYAFIIIPVTAVNGCSFRSIMFGFDGLPLSSAPALRLQSREAEGLLEDYYGPRLLCEHTDLSQSLKGR